MYYRLLIDEYDDWTSQIDQDEEVNPDEEESKPAKKKKKKKSKRNDDELVDPEFNVLSKSN